MDVGLRRPRAFGRAAAQQYGLTALVRESDEDSRELLKRTTCDVGAAVDPLGELLFTHAQFFGESCGPYELRRVLDNFLFFGLHRARL